MKQYTPFSGRKQGVTAKEMRYPENPFLLLFYWFFLIVQWSFRIQQLEFNSSSFIIIRQPLCPVVGRRPQNALQITLSCAVLCHIQMWLSLITSDTSLHNMLERTTENVM